MIKNRIVKNAGWIIGTKIAQSVIGLIISMITARYLGPSNYGIITYAASLVTFVTPIMYLGFSNVLVQEIVNDEEKSGEIVGTSIVLSVISALICIIGITCFCLITSRAEPETIVVCSLYSILLIFQAADLVQYWFQAKLLSKYTSITSLVAYVVVALYKIYLLITEKAVRWFAVSNALDFLIIAFILLFLFKKLSGYKLSFNFETAKRMFNKSKHYIVSSMMVNIFAQTDRIMIKHMIGNADTGYYSAAVACAGITGFIISAIIDSMRPVIFESKKVSVEKFEENMKILYSIIIFLSLLQSIFIAFFSKSIIHLLYGEKFVNAIPALRIIVWYTTFSYLGSVRNIWILAENKQKYLWIINFSGASVNIVLNFFLIPIWGVCGASFASLITQIFTNVIIGYIMPPIRYNNYIMSKSISLKLLKRNIKKILKKL